MTKRITTYRSYAISDIKTRAEIPAQSNIVTRTTDASCNSISLGAIAAVLGVDTSTSLRRLCTHANVNKWSEYGPYTRDVNGTADSAGNGAYLRHNKPTSNYQIGMFAGYNHGAQTPSIYNTNHDQTLSIASGGTAIFDCAVVLGELKLTNISSATKGPARGLAFVVWDGATLIDASVSDLELMNDDNIAHAFQIRKTGVTSTKTYTCQLRLVDSATQYNYSPTNVVCGITELADYSKTVRIQAATYVSVTGVYTATFGSSGATPAFNLTTGAITSNGLTYNHSYATSLTVRAWVETWDGSALTDVYYLRNAAAGAYTSGSDVITQHPTVYTDPGSTAHPALNRVIWTSGGVTKTLPMDSYDLVIRIDFAGV